ncbi:fimbrial protein [Citrobacter europaeus]|uniref:fimbrial protein n=1 Tax=Citrobacter europaeus TaxID=1914243 RepID=UPI0039C08F1F
MKELKLILIFSVCLAAVIHAPQVRADAGTSLTLSGEVKASPCTVDDLTKTIDLGAYYVATMAKGGDYVKFSVTLSSCPTGTSSVSATFSGDPDSSSPQWYYANTKITGAATGIHIELASDETVKKGLGNGRTMKVTVGTDRKAEFKLQARINKGDSAPSAGLIQTTVNITYSYS